jgi:hypothetical protein
MPLDRAGSTAQQRPPTHVSKRWRCSASCEQTTAISTASRGALRDVPPGAARILIEARHAGHRSGNKGKNDT